jgi:TetR/AcrR family transcriptional regulator, transcriptional repressor for nem operon
MRYAPGHKDRMRERILVETARTIREGGPGDVSVAGVMSRIGLTHGGFYVHFKSRDELLDEVVEYMLAQAVVMLQTVTLRSGPAAALSAYICNYLSDAHRDALDDGCPLPALVAEIRHLPPRSQRLFAEGWASLVALMAEGLARLRDEPVEAQLPVGREATEALAATLIAEMVGAVQLARALRGTPGSDTILQQARDSVLRRAGLPAV